MQSGSRRSFHRDLEDLESELVRLAALATESIAIGTDALLNLDLAAIDDLIIRDRAIDDLALDIQERACAVLACQQPMAGDLRTLVAVFRMVHGLERIGDNMLNVARAARHLYPQQLTPKLRGLIELMRHQAILQLRTAVEAFVERDVKRAMEVAEMDQKMSQLQQELFSTILGGSSDDPTVRQAVQVALVGRYFERIADQAVSVGERVDYIVTGELHHPDHSPDAANGGGADRMTLSDRVADGEAATGSEPRYINRDLSWLDFNARVLDLAEDTTIPLLERVKFLAIFSQNLDEFFQVRVAGLRDQLEAGLGPPGPDGLTPHETLLAVRVKVAGLIERHTKVFLADIVPALAAADMGLCEFDSLDADDRAYLVEVFNTRIFPVLTPLSVDPAHPFPYISNLSLNLAVIVRDPVTGDRRFARVKVPPLLPRFVVLGDRHRVVALEQIIAAHLDLLFPGMEVEAHHTFRVTRNADFAVEEEEADDLLAAVEMELRRRRFGEAVRLEIDGAATPEIRELLVRELALDEDDVYDVDGPLDLGALWGVTDIDRPDLKDDAWAPMTQPGLATASNEPVDLFSVLREHEVLVHYPYDSFATSIEAFVSQAASDPHVLAIKQTLYRTSGDSQIVRSLVEAAERGKQVVALVELKARFDEQRNIEWARALEEAGCHVVYGLVGYKTHAKLLLVVRQDDDGVRRYCHVGTGNYNAKTARLYEDFGLLSCDPALGADLTDLFNYLTGYARAGQYKRLLVAPTTLRPRIVEMIGEQAALGAHGSIIMKLNSLHDQAVIEALYDASRAGVPIELVVRGICGLVPGVPGLSETIRVRSILGRFLEHSRVFVFGGRDDNAARYFIGSSDMMPGNLDRRIEAVTPVEAPDLTRRIQEVVDVLLADDAPAWMLQPDETWRRVNRDGVSVQRRLQELALARARRRRDRESAANEG